MVHRVCVRDLIDLHTLNYRKLNSLDENQVGPRFRCKGKVKAAVIKTRGSNGIRYTLISNSLRVY